MMSSLNWVDYIILGIFLLSVITGFSRGLVKELLSVITLIVAVIVAAMFASTLAESLTSTQTVSEATSNMSVNTAHSVSLVALGLSYAILFAATILVGAIISFFINLAITSGTPGFSNRLLGAAFGFGRGFLLNLSFIFILQMTAISQESWWKNSVCVNAYQPSVIWLSGIVSPTIEKLKTKASETLQNVKSQVQQQAQDQVQQQVQQQEQQAPQQ
ncbi:MAG TPA: CvpA family protein [Gammaproteobacteria bacterium]|jgi:membrane protein required for colicin V production|nr:CvpA family protein [Gammaproteobacteria bacterium]